MLKVKRYSLKRPIYAIYSYFNGDKIMKKTILISLALFTNLQTMVTHAMQEPQQLAENEATKQLFDAAGSGDYKIIKALVAQGAQVNAQRNPDKYTPLHVAISLSPTEESIASAQQEKYRLEARMGELGVPDEFVYAYPSTATLALADQYQKTIEALIQAGASSNIKNNDGTTQKDLARKTGQPRSIMQVLQ